MDEKQEVRFSCYAVKFGQVFIDHFNNFPIADQDKIYNFVSHVGVHGFSGLPGRNKPSHEVPTDDPKFLEKVRYAQKHNLWHYHIGIPDYDTDRAYGDWTSEYVIHYTLNENEVLIVDLEDHPPLTLPKEKFLR